MATISKPQELKTVAVVGQGYVGLPLSILALESGWRVVGVDSDETKLEELRQGRSPHDHRTCSELKKGLRSDSYFPTSCMGEAAAASAWVICVPTDLADGRPDYTNVVAAAEEISAHLTRGQLVILESTVGPGTTENLVKTILEKGSGLEAGKEFFLGFSPERIDPGNPDWNETNIPKLISGINADSLDHVSRFYGSLGVPTISVSSPIIAECAKLFENVFRFVNIGLVNDFARSLAHAGVDVREVLASAATKPFGYMGFHPGPGIGGHCLPVDPEYLQEFLRETVGNGLATIHTAKVAEDEARKFALEKVLDELTVTLARAAGAQVLIVGVGYKGNSSDLRNSPAISLGESLAGLGILVSFYDPVLPPQNRPSGLLWMENFDESKLDLVINFSADKQWQDNCSATRVLDMTGTLDMPNSRYLFEPIERADIQRSSLT